MAGKENDAGGVCRGIGSNLTAKFPALSKKVTPVAVRFFLTPGLTMSHKDYTVGNLHSFSDDGYFSPQILVQSSYIFLKCSENYFGKF